MAEKSKIQWTDATWNIAVGCSKVDEDCKFCYMYRGSMDGKRYDPKYVRKTKTVFNLPLKLKEPSRIFTSSLTDVFHEECDSFRVEMWDIIRKCPQHTFQILTKRPERINQCLPEDWGESGWKNVWLGTSIGSNSESARKRVVDLSMCNHDGIKFLSVEPMYERVELSSITTPIRGIDYFVLPAIDWVIVGGESGNETGKYRYRPCEIEWIENVIKDCEASNIPVFVKQVGTYLSQRLGMYDRHGGNIEEWPSRIQLRQFPR